MICRTCGQTIPEATVDQLKAHLDIAEKNNDMQAQFAIREAMRRLEASNKEGGV